MLPQSTLYSSALALRAIYMQAKASPIWSDHPLIPVVICNPLYYAFAMNAMWQRISVHYCTMDTTQLQIYYEEVRVQFQGMRVEHGQLTMTTRIAGTLIPFSDPSHKFAKAEMDKYCMVHLRRLFSGTNPEGVTIHAVHANLRHMLDHDSHRTGLHLVTSSLKIHYASVALTLDDADIELFAKTPKLRPIVKGLSAGQICKMAKTISRRLHRPYSASEVLCRLCSIP